jgi:GTP:adenosylcobinamide-phosphate guanylyltransferase
MVLRVLDALQGSREVDTRIMVGPSMSAVDSNAELSELLRSDQVRWLAPKATPSTSAFSALQSLPENVPVLLTTADHALLTSEMVDHFCETARKRGFDVLAGVVRHELVAEAFPETKRTVTKLSDGGYCGCNLFAFLTPQARMAADFWRKVEKERKKPLRIIKVIGWTTVLRYLLGRLSLEQALSQLSKKMHLKVGVVRMPFPEAAVDVDKIEDLTLVESILAKKQSG